MNNELVNMRDYVKIAKKDTKIKILIKRNNEIINAYIGEVAKNRYYIWSNYENLRGARGNSLPGKKGYKYSWVIMSSIPESVPENMCIIIDNKKILCNNNIEFTNK